MTINCDILWNRKDLITTTKGIDVSSKFLRYKKVKGISIDTRTIKKNDLFIALKGPNFDGHSFIEDALLKGAAGILVSDENHANKYNGLLVKNTFLALEQLAEFSRKRFRGNVIAITGSNGKTSTKDMALKILSQYGKTHATENNNNNKLGLFLTLTRLNKKYNYCILELGMNHINELREMSLIAKPNAIIITNVSPSHIGNFRSEKHIAIAKSEIFIGLKKKGYVFLNSKNKWYNFLKNIASNYTSNIFEFGGKNSFKNFELQINELNSGLTLKNKSFSIDLSHLPEHLFLNLTSIILLLQILKLDLKLVKNIIKNLKPSEGRGNSFQINLKYSKNVTIINDAYNASPGSMLVSLNNFKSVKNKKIVLVLGDMYELGGKSIFYHKKLIPIIKKISPKTLITVGNFSKVLTDYFKDQFTCKNYIDVKILKERFENLVRDNDTILIKGSHGTGLFDFCIYLKKVYGG